MHRISVEHAALDGRAARTSYSLNFRQVLRLGDGEVVVAQLVERSLPIPEVRGSKPDIGKIYIELLFTAFLTRRK